MLLIINADDFGIDADTNKAIAFCFSNGLITNTTAMVNMPSFQEGLLLAKKDGFIENIGLHVNLFEGLPLSDTMRSVPLFFDSSKNSLTSGILLKTEKKFFLTKKEKKAVAEEVRRQFQKYLFSGLKEMHFDSHGHSHTCWSLWKIIRKEAELNHFLSSRLSLNLGNSKNFLKKIYKNFFNHNLSKRFGTTDFFTDINGFISHYSEISEKQSVEIMVHPRYQNGRLINLGQKDGRDELMELHKFVIEHPSIHLLSEKELQNYGRFKK